MVSFYGPNALKLISEELHYSTPTSLKRRHFNIASLRLASKLSQKHGVKGWFLSLPIEMRKKVLSICDGEFTSQVIQMFMKKLELGEISVHFNQCDSDFEKMFTIKQVNFLPTKIAEAEREIEMAVRLTDTHAYLDTFTLDDSLVEDPERFWNCVMLISRKEAFTAPCKEYKQTDNTKKYNWEVPVWFNSVSSLAGWVCCALEQAIWIGFAQSHKKVTLPEIGFTRQLAQLPEVWSKLPNQQQKELLGSLESLDSDFTEVKQILRKTIPKKQYSQEEGSFHDAYLSQIRINFHRYHYPKTFENLYQCPDLLKILAYTPLDRAVTPFDVVSRKILHKIMRECEQMLLVELEGLIPVQKKKAQKKRKQEIVKAESTPTSPSPRENEFEFVHEIVCEVIQRALKLVPPPRMVDDTSSEEFQTVSKKIKPTKKVLMKKPSRKKPKQNLPLVRPQEISRPKPRVQAFQVRNIVPTQDCDFPPLRQDNLHCEIVKYVRDSELKLKTELIYGMVDRLKIFLNCILPGCQVILFGSYATGLALSTSDVDLQVTHVDYMSRERIEQGCIEITRHLMMYPWVRDPQCIPRASIPLVKAEVNLGAFTGNPTDGFINVDISFNDVRGLHVGESTLKKTVEMLGVYPSLKYLTVVLKSLLAKHGLNSAYTGGIGSYALLVWAAGILKYRKNLPSDYGEQLMCLFEVLGTQFDSKVCGIDINHPDVFFKTKGDLGLVTIDPACETNNITRTAFNAEKVFLLFAECYKVISSLKANGITTGLLPSIL